MVRVHKKLLDFPEWRVSKENNEKFMFLTAADKTSELYDHSDTKML